MKATLYLATLFLFLGSCSKQSNEYLVNSLDDEGAESISYCGDSLIYIEYAFIGITNNYFLFESYIENTSADTIIIDHTQIQMDVLEGTVLEAFSREELVSKLQTEKEELRETKKKRTIANIALTGLEILAAAATGNSAGSTLLFSTEPIVYIFDDRRFFQRGINSVDEEIEYIRNMGLGNESIPPNYSITKDVFFPLQEISSEVGLILSKDRIEYICYFDQDLFIID